MMMPIAILYISLLAGRMLNLYSSGTARNGMNVLLYTEDNTNEQKWVFDGDKLLYKMSNNQLQIIVARSKTTNKFKKQKEIFIMARLANETYRFINRRTNEALNIYGTNTSGIKNGTNVCLYEASSSDKMQQFKVENGVIYCATNSQFVLDHSSGMSTSATGNAHMYTKSQSSSSDYSVTIDVSGSYCTIKLGNGKKLTAVDKI